MVRREFEHLIFFDGVCGLCNNSVDFIIKRDKKNIFLFTSLQSEEAKEVLARYNYPIEKIKNLSNIVYLRKGKIEEKSKAVLFILWDLSGFYKLMVIGFLIPNFIRDWVYGIVSKNRYLWFGKKEVCRVPAPHEKEKFLNFQE